MGKMPLVHLVVAVVAPVGLMALHRYEATVEPFYLFENIKIGHDGADGGDGGIAGPPGGGGGGAGGGGAWPAGFGGSGGEPWGHALGGYPGAGGIGVLAVVEGGLLENCGPIIINSQSCLAVSDTLSKIENFGDITLNPGSLIEVKNSSYFFNQGNIESSDLTSSGTLVLDSQGLFQNEGLLSAWIDNNGILINNGDAYICMNHEHVSGVGSFYLVANYGTMAPGDGIGKLVMENGYSGEGSLHIQLAGTSTSPLMHDVLEIRGDFEIGSETLDLGFVDGFEESDLAHGDFFDIVQYTELGLRTGEFSAIVDTSASLDLGSWVLEYDQEVVPGELYSIRLIYSNDPSSAPDLIIPSQFVMHNPYPNPFNPITKIVFDLPRASSPRFSVFDLAGHLVWERNETNPLSAGRHEIVWRGEDSMGRAMPSGTYLFKMEADEFRATKRMVLVR